METNSAQMCHDLIMMLRRIKSALIVVAEEYDMTPGQVGALYAIMNGGGTMGQVAQTLHCDASNATGIIDRLVAHGLVVRQESEQDRRVKTLQLTVKGRKITEDIVDRLPTTLGCDNLTPGERHSIHTAINKLTVL